MRSLTRYFNGKLETIQLIACCASVDQLDQQNTYSIPLSEADGRAPLQRSDSQPETPPTPLFDEDTSQPLEEFPRINYEGPGWEVQLRQPNKKKITGQRYKHVPIKKMTIKIILFKKYYYVGTHFIARILCKISSNF